MEQLRWEARPHLSSQLAHGAPAKRNIGSARRRAGALCCFTTLRQCVALLRPACCKTWPTIAANLRAICSDTQTRDCGCHGAAARPCGTLRSDERPSDQCNRKLVSLSHVNEEPNVPPPEIATWPCNANQRLFQSPFAQAGLCPEKTATRHRHSSASRRGGASPHRCTRVACGHACSCLRCGCAFSHHAKRAPWGASPHRPSSWQSGTCSPHYTDGRTSRLAGKHAGKQASKRAGGRAGTHGGKQTDKLAETRKRECQHKLNHKRKRKRKRSTTPTQRAKTQAHTNTITIALD